jgi:predicted nucleic acid-binding Zn ribbon protein
MAFCSGCGAALREDVHFCSACGISIRTPNRKRLRPFAILLLVIGGLYLLMASEQYNSPRHQLVSAFGGSDPGLQMTTLYGLAVGITGIVLYTSEPNIFLMLNRAGMVAFVILMAILPIVSWIPWLVPGWREKGDTASVHTAQG